MTVVELIERKRDGHRLNNEEIAWLINSYAAEEIPDYQISALLMAIYFNGLDEQELSTWTEAMLHSGDVLSFPDVKLPLVDKHSTGGVGDKVSIALAPLVAACGVAVPMMSGRGLGHTGGTLDKLESIPGFRTDLRADEFDSLVSEVGFALGGQTRSLVPADRRLYALRDVTATVPSIPLIASSIMSKKLAESLDGLVLDVKVGLGAFMADLESAHLLAETMVGIGHTNDTRTVALLTNMDQPLGVSVGNSNETVECFEILKGEGPGDLRELVLALGSEMLVLGGVWASQAESRAAIEDAITSGAALEKLGTLIEKQGGDPSVLGDYSLMPQAPAYHELVAPIDGYVTQCHAKRIGEAAVRLGAGRLRKEDSIDARVGLEVLAKVGDRVSKGQPLVRIGYSGEDKLQSALAILEEAWILEAERREPPPLILGEVR